MRYGLIRRLKRGVSVAFTLTYRCNLSCPYCSIKIPSGGYPKKNEVTLDQLVDFVEKFPYRIREAYLSGGSPELHSGFVPFASYLLSKGICVKVFTNLTRPDILLQLPQSHRLCITASYHHTKEWESLSIEEYTENYKLVKSVHRVDVEEIGEKWLPYSKLKFWSDEEGMRANNKMIRVGPDLKMYSTCYDIYSDV